MMRELNLNEMEMVSGGEDVVVATGTQTASNDFDWQIFLQDYLRAGPSGGSHGGAGVYGQIGGSVEENPYLSLGHGYVGGLDTTVTGWSENPEISFGLFPPGISTNHFSVTITSDNNWNLMQASCMTMTEQGTDCSQFFNEP